jgi:hypothetical protein
LCPILLGYNFAGGRLVRIEREYPGGINCGLA